MVLFSQGGAGYHSLLLRRKMSAVSPSPGRLSPGRKTPPSVSVPSPGLRLLIVSRFKWGREPCRGHSVLPCAGNTIWLQCSFIKLYLRIAGRFDIGPPGTRSGRDRALPHLRLETISGRSGPCPVFRKPPPESFVPGDNLPGGRRRNQFCWGYGSPSVLNEVSHEFSTAMRFEKCERSP